MSVNAKAEKGDEMEGPSWADGMFFREMDKEIDDARRAEGADNEEDFIYHPLEDIEDVDLFYQAVDREKMTQKLSPERPYTYWTIELYDQENGIRGGGGLGILAADTRRTAERMAVGSILPLSNRSMTSLFANKMSPSPPARCTMMAPGMFSAISRGVNPSW